MSRLRLWQGSLPQHALPNGRASDTLFNRSKHSQTADAAVGEDIETHMRSFPGVQDFIEHVPRVRLQLRASEHRLPGELRILKLLQRQIRGVAAFQGTTLRKIAFEP